MERDGQFLLEVNKFCTAGAKGRADNRPELCRSALIHTLHPVDGLLDDVEGASPPAVVDGSNDIVYGIMEQDCLAVGLLNQQADTGLAGDQAICIAIFRIVVNVFGNTYLIAMNLVG